MTVAEERQKWTDDRVDDFKEAVGTNFRELKTEMNTRFDKVEDEMNARFEKVDKRFDKVDARFEALDQRFHELNLTLLIGAGGITAALIACCATLVGVAVL